MALVTGSVLDEAPGGQFDAVGLGDELQVGLLADGHDDHIGFPGRGLIIKIGGGEPALLVEDPLHRPQGDTADLAAGGVDLFDAPAVDDGNAFVLGLFHFPNGGGHLFPGFQADEADVAPLAPGGAGHIHGHVAAADDQHLFAVKGEFLAHGRILQVFHAPEHALGVGPRHRQANGILGPYAEEDGAETVPGEEVVDGAVAADGGVAVDLHPAALNIIHFPIQDFPGQPVGRDAVAQPAAGFRGGLEDHRLIALEGQVIGAAQTRGTGADDGHLLALLGGIGHRQGAPVHVVGHKALQVADGDGLIHFLAAAVGFARVGTDAADGARQGQPIHDQGQGLGILALLDELDVTLGAEIGGAGPDARGPVRFLDGERGGNGLGIEPVNRFALRQPEVEFVGHRHRANLGTGPAAGAFAGVDVARFFIHADRKIPRLTRDALYFRQGVDLDVQVPTAFHQFGGDDAHGAVIGGEGLVQLGHDPADGRLLFHQMDIETGVSQVQGRLHPGDPGAYHHNLTYFPSCFGCHKSTFRLFRIFIHLISYIDCEITHLSILENHLQ